MDYCCVFLAYSLVVGFFSKVRLLSHHISMEKSFVFLSFPLCLLIGRLLCIYHVLLELIHPNEGIGDQGEVNDIHEEDIEFVISREYVAEPFQAKKQSFDLLPSLVQFFIVFPRIASVFLGRYNGDNALKRPRRQNSWSQVRLDRPACRAHGPASDRT